MAPQEVSRRSFIQAVAAGTVGLSVTGAPALQAQGANDRIVLAVMGVNRRGAQSARISRCPTRKSPTFATSTTRRSPRARRGRQGGQTQVPKAEKDIRKILEDKDVDALVIAAPDHWHAPPRSSRARRASMSTSRSRAATTPREGELLVAAARKHSRVVQMGNQRRSWPEHHRGDRADARGTLIGRVYFARGWYANTRASIGAASPLPSRRARLRPLAGTRAAARVQGQHHPLQLALVLALGHRRSLEQRRARDRRGALGAGRRLTRSASRRRAADITSRTTGEPRHADHDLRVPRAASIVWEGLSCNASSARALALRHHVPRRDRQRSRR